MTLRRAVAGRLIVLLEDERAIEARPLGEIEADLRLAGVDPVAAIGRVRQLASAGGSPAAVLLARIADAEATEREVEELDGAPLEDVRARLTDARTALGADAGHRVDRLVNGVPQARIGPAPARPERQRSAWLSPAVVVGLLRLADAGVVLLAALAACLTRFQSLDTFGALELFGSLLAMLLTVNILQLAGLYRFARLTELSGQAGRLVLAWAAVMLSLLALGFMTQAPLLGVSRLWVGLWFVYGLLGLLAVRLAFKHQIRRWQAAGRLTRNLVIVGAGEQSERLIEHLGRHVDPGLRIVGVFDDRRGRVPDQVGGQPVRGSVDDLLAFAHHTPVDQVILALPWQAEGRVRGWMKKLRSLPVDVCFCPRPDGAGLSPGRITRVAGLPMLSLAEKPLAGWSYIVKGLEDRVLAATILVFILPLLLVIAALIKLDSPGPALFRQKRHGINDQVIDVFKFRTMYVEHCDDRQVVQVTRNDPRVTRFGQFLRRSSLDELPQFLNVLMGTMSIVGPRPHAVAHDEYYARLIEDYLARRRVKPGITGWAQVNGLRGEIQTLERMAERVRYDLYYIDNWSLWFDLRIILRTAFVAFRDSYAY